MNYLAHSMISLELDKKLTKDRSTLYGNFTGDFYKGKIEKINLPENLKEGVVLHRIIDSISDRENNYLNDILSKDFGIFKGIVSDIVIDHFISKNLLLHRLSSKLQVIFFEKVLNLTSFKRSF